MINARLTQINVEIYIQTGIKMDGRTYRRTNRQTGTDRQTDGRTYRQMDRQTDGRVGGWTYKKRLCALGYFYIQGKAR